MLAEVIQSTLKPDETMNFVTFLLVGAVAGWLAGLIVKGRGFGIIGNIIVGIAGGFIGGWLMGLLNFQIGTGVVNHILTALIGAVVLLFVIGLVKKKR